MNSNIHMFSSVILLWIFMVIYRKSCQSERELEYRMIGMDRYDTNHFDPYKAGPEVNLGFIHMRKAGGTHFDTIINEFMMVIACNCTLSSLPLPLLFSSLSLINMLIKSGIWMYK